MSKILKILQERDLERAKKEGQVFILSRKIQEICGIEEIPKKRIDIETGKYRLVSESRCFSNGWVDLLEIKKASGNEWGEPEGTATINLPPQDVQNEFFKELKAFLQ